MKKLGTSHQNLDHKVYKAIKSMIIERKLTPGTKISQNTLAHELGVSRTPVVNALKKLEHEKLVLTIPRKGVYVRQFSKQEMVHIFELREVLEGLAARRVAMEISDDQIQKLQGFFKNVNVLKDSENLKKYAEEDRQFHNFLIEIGGKEFIAGILETYNIIIFSYQVDAYEGLVRFPEETIPEHRAIIEAISNKDPVRAEQLIRLHISNTTKKLRREVENNETTKVLKASGVL
jgi:DNA-binding GntR family transcriptional regulator